MQKKGYLVRVVVVGILIALQVIVSRFLSIQTPFLKIGFGFLPMAVAAILYGPVYAGVAWGLSDFIGATLFPFGPYFFGFTASAILNGVIFGVFIYKNHTKVWRIAAAIAISSAIVSLGLDTVWLTTLYATPFEIVIGERLLRCAVMVPVEFILIFLAGNRFSSFFYRNSTPALQKGRLRREAAFYYNGDFLKERRQISEKIVSQLTGLSEYKTAKTVFCYVGKPTEIDTTIFIERAFGDGKTVAVPLCEDKMSMTARVIGSFDQLTEGRFGVREPKFDRPVVPKEQIDFAVIPSLYGDALGHRVGFGGGYYDRYLEKSGMRKVILCPDAMFKRRLPVFPFDLKADMVVSENNIRRAR